MSLASQTVKVLGPAGILARSWPAFEGRAGQVDLAEAAARALESRSALVVEAGTGTGKTLAYLVPAVLSGLKTIISTATKTLQEQLLGKDLPFLARHLSAAPSACLVKGRQNYLCRRRLAKGLAEGGVEPWLGRKLSAWAEGSDSGDRAQVDFLAEDDPAWLRLTATSEQCLGQECDFFGACFITRLRRKAAAARLVVVNHHLFMADLALRQGGFGQVLPEAEAVIFDEAHELEEAATSHFTLVVSDLRLLDLGRDLAEAAGGPAAELAARLRAASLDLAAALEFKGERAGLTDELLTPEARRAGQALGELLHQAQALALAEAADEAEAQALAGRAERLRDALTMILERSEPEYVYYAERLRRGLALKAAPVEVGGLLKRLLFSRPKGFVFTSATLDPPRFRARLGLGAGVEELSFPSPYDFAGQSRLYVPTRLARPDDPGFPRAVAAEMERLVALSRGRAFLLFTSNRNLTAVHRILAPRLPYPVLRQGQAPKAKLLEEFLRQEGAVLMATASFWQGVDIAGPALSLVAIDKLPFAPPDDPLVAARVERLRALGQDPFLEYHLPEAILALRQGLGRLLRSQTDAGVLAVLDVRLTAQAYGRIILEALPPSPVVRDLAELARWVGERLT